MRDRVYVVGTDLSMSSRTGLDAAVSLARRTAARLDLFCAVPPHLARADHKFTGNVAAAIARIARRAGCEDARRHVVKAPDAAAALARHARAVGAEAIVVGPHGWNAMRRVALGSVTERLLRHAPMLLVARGPLAETGVPLLAAVDGTTGSRRALRVAVATARALGTSVVALHAVPRAGAAAMAAPERLPPDVRRAEFARVERARREFAAWVRAFPKDGVRVEPRVVEGPAVETILAEARALRAPLVVVGSHGKTPAHEFFVGSVARAVVQHAPVSVLVVRARPGRPVLARLPVARKRRG